MLIKRIKINREREIRLCGIPVLQYGSHNMPGTHIAEKYVRLFHKRLEHQFLDRILSQIPQEHDYIFLLRTDGMGEAFLLNFMIEELKKKKHFQNPCFVSHRAIYRDLMGMWSDIPFYHDSMNTRQEWNMHLLQPIYRYKGRTFHVYHAPLKVSGQFISQEDPDAHYVEIIARYTGSSIRYYPPCISADAQESALSKAHAIGLDTNNFLFLIPEANSTTAVDASLWDSLSDQLSKMGYDLFVNMVSGVSAWGKTTHLSLPEAYYLASLSKGIISIRCGFTEILSLLDLPKHVIYTRYGFQNLSARHVMLRTSIKQYPGVNPDSIFEYDAETDLDLAQNIIRSLRRIVSFNKEENDEN